MNSIGLTRARLEGARKTKGLIRAKDETNCCSVENISRHVVNLVCGRSSGISMGVTRSRLAGARAATAEVLVFWDAHCEGGQDWLRPLLQRIKQNCSAVLTPLIDVISLTKFGIGGGPYYFQVILRLSFG